MKSRKLIVLVVALALMAGTAWALTWLRANQKLGQPGIKATPIPGSVVMNIDLPNRVLEFTATTSTNLPQSQEVLDYLPPDTSFAQRIYQAPDGVGAIANIVLQGADRTSIHKPDYCIPGHGWTPYDKVEVPIAIGGPHPYTMPISKWTLRIDYHAPDGTTRELHGLYLFWFVADNVQTPDYGKRQRLLYWNLLRTGVMQRWAYISYFTTCAPGQEDLVFDRIKKLIAASVPEFQLPPKSADTSVVATQ